MKEKDKTRLEILAQGMGSRGAWRPSRSIATAPPTWWPRRMRGKRRMAALRRLDLSGRLPHLTFWADRPLPRP